jgi:hypothetical protein
MTTCGRCGTSNLDDAMRCSECGDYLHQYRRKRIGSNPAMISSVIAAVLGLAAIGGAFLPFIQVAGLLERRMADSPDGIIVLGVGLVMLVAAAIDGFSGIPRFVKPACLTCGVLLLATIAVDVEDLKTRTSALLGSLNQLTAAFLPTFQKLSVTDLIGSGVYSEVVAGSAAVIVGLVAPVKSKRRSLITDVGTDPVPYTWRLSINPIAGWTLATAIILLGAYSYAIYTHPQYASPPPGRGTHAVMARLDPHRPLPDRVVISTVGIGRKADGSGPALDQMYVSVYRFNLFSWDLIFRSPGDSQKTFIEVDSKYLNSDGTYIGGISREFVGVTPLGTNSDKLVFWSLDCGASCAAETVNVVAWRNDALVVIGAVVNGSSKLDIRLTKDSIYLHGRGYAEGDGHCCPSIANDEATITGDGDGIRLSGGTYQSAPIAPF